MAQPFKAPSGVYYIRRKVPESLRPTLGREFKRSLKTSDPSEAKRLFAKEWAASEELFARARAQSAGAIALSQRDIRILAESWHDAELARMEASGDFSGWLADGGQVMVEHGGRLEEYTPLITLQEALDNDPASAELMGTAGIVRSALRAKNIPMPAQDSAEYETLQSLFREQALKLSELALARHRGNWAVSKSPLAGEALSFETDKATVKPRKGLLSVFEDYAEDRQLTDGKTRAVLRSIDAYRALVKEFTELCGDLPVADITREVVRQYRADIATMPARGEGIRKLTARQKIAKANEEGLPPIEAATIRNKVRAISAVLSYALRMQLIPENPIIAGGIGNAAAKAASKRSTARRNRNFYNDAELTAIFTSPVFTQEGWAPPRADFGKAWYWMPLLMYYTGARREELAQLAVRDVKTDQAEIGPYLSILNAEGEDDGDRGVKNDGSRRSIPLHSDLIQLGFLEYVKTQHQGGALFPKLEANPAGYFGANFGKRWAEYLRKTVDLDSPANPSHGFRHTFKTLCRKVGIPEDVSDAITGHAGPASVSRDYGEMPLIRMAQEIKKLPSCSLVPILLNR